jgi:ABC-2 type transport system permease protein
VTSSHVHDRATPEAAAGGRWRSLGLLVHEVRMQQLLFWRNRESAVFVFLFPPLLFLLLGSVYNDTIDGERAVDVLLIGILGYGCANTALAGLAISLVIRRESGLLKRVRATPLPAPTYLAAVLLSTLVVFVLQIALTLVLGFLLFDADAPASWAALAIALLLGVAALAGMGFGVASLIRSDEGASAVVNLVVLPMAFLSGSFGSTNDYPNALQAVSDVLPLTYLLRLTKDAYLHGEYLTSDLTGVAVLVAWGIAGYVVATKRFGWQPREK